MLEFRSSRVLTEDGARIRNAVFIEEQGFEEELDAIDAAAVHIVLYQEEKPVAVCRYFWNEQQGAYTVGRLAVVREFRGRNLGAAVLREAERQIKEAHGEKIAIAAQAHAREFYEKQGYKAVGGEFLEEGHPHIQMYKELV